VAVGDEAVLGLGHPKALGVGQLAETVAHLGDTAEILPADNYMN
jgi:hypothetical protein